MVASRWPYRLPLAASVRLSTSASVRYSRVRNSALGLRTGMATVRFSVTGATSFRCDLATVFRAPLASTVRIINVLRTVSAHLAGQTRRGPLEHDPRFRINGTNRPKREILLLAFGSFD